MEVFPKLEVIPLLGRDGDFWPKGRYGHGFQTLVVDGQIVVISCGGKFDQGEIASEIEAFNGTAWRRIEAQESDHRYAHACFAYNNKIWIYGGKSESKTLKDDLMRLEILDIRSPQSNQTTPSTPVNHQTQNQFPQTPISNQTPVQNHIPIQTPQTQHYYSPQTPIRNQIPTNNVPQTPQTNNIPQTPQTPQTSSKIGAHGEWIRVKTCGSTPPPRAYFAWVVVENLLYIMGGMGRIGNSDVLLNDMYQFDLTTSIWKAVPVTGVVPNGRYGHSATLVAERYIMFYGGREKDGQPTNHISFFDILNQRYIQIESPLPKRASHTVTWVGDFLLVIGGDENGLPQSSLPFWIGLKSFPKIVCEYNPIIENKFNFPLGTVLCPGTAVTPLGIVLFGGRIKSQVFNHAFLITFQKDQLIQSPEQPNQPIVEKIQNNVSNSIPEEKKNRPGKRVGFFEMAKVREYERDGHLIEGNNIKLTLGNPITEYLTELKQESDKKREKIEKHEIMIFQQQ